MRPFVIWLFAYGKWDHHYQEGHIIRARLWGDTADLLAVVFDHFFPGW